MWLLTFLPDTFIHLLVLLSLAGIVTGFLFGSLPGISQYKLVIQIVSILLLGLSLYLEGGIANEANWQAKISEMEIKVIEAEAKAARKNVEVITNIVTKRDVIKQKGKDIIEYVDREVVKYNNTCVIPDAAIIAHDAAAKNVPINQIKIETKP